MKRILNHLFFLLAFSFYFSTTSFAQPKHAFTIRSVYYNYITPIARESSFGDIWTKTPGVRGIEFAYQRLVDDNTYLVFPLKIGIAGIPKSSLDLRPRTETIGNFDILVQRQFFKYGNFINPFIHFGLGTTYRFRPDELNLNIPLGVGLNFRLGDDFYFTAQTQYRPSERKHDGWHHGLGFTVLFGGKPAISDRDNDGISDADDRCPDVFGLAALAGCPDADGDGVADLDDKCPEVPGLAALAGCPDRDGDNITDAEDECPNIAGLAQFSGCPDTDGDGLPDNKDKCPTQAGPIANGGCPVSDRDGDGIPDADDLCPDQKGPATTKGCPDKDGDGIADKDDACPDKPGIAAGRGCPDTDGDGLYDNEDRCPNEAGTKSNRGCPEIKQEDREKLKNIIKNVQFETGKATLLARSYPVLDEVVKLMEQYPSYSLRISGHTDNVGDDAFNQQLSERRAKTCYDYLVSKNVSPSRMSHAGYGETRPIADNKTAAGREINRRVDFELYIKD